MTDEIAYPIDKSSEREALFLTLLKPVLKTFRSDLTRSSSKVKSILDPIMTVMK